ncbi:hypothetical protein N7474_004636 [Penicillium riverlandense]|uniref:uncharacterized protein n=1 Tax=Penicillium riverlandense TaxID=1903569 RepID=UPI002546D820|nr:uncharacterized protein N7474_004636 [Penicillium riverlandense]KAJ5819045.1 hypothetical protein N7474_004636 [Penicillium riverlandense]
MPIVKRAVKGVAAGIGLASESLHARKMKKEGNDQAQSSSEDAQSERSLSQDNNEPPVYQTELYTSEEHLPAQTTGVIQNDENDTLEEQWELDEAQEELQQQHLTETKSSDASAEEVDGAALATDFVRDHPAPPPYVSYDGLSARPPKLSAPVVLPQRRPKNLDRGFIRAYAPVLKNYGIDQTMFLDFLDTAEKSTKSARWMKTINLASLATIALPSATGMAIGIAIQIATDVAMAVDTRYRSSRFFAKINKEFFQPRGLFCLVMTWNPQLAGDPSTVVDLNTSVAKATGGGGGDMLSRLQFKFKSSDGKSYGDFFPEVAPLIFPSLDQLSSAEDAEKKISKTKQRQQFVAGYLDRRAQASFRAENPDSVLNQGPEPKFSSRYADPTHPAASGDLFGLVTGGYLTRENGKDKIRGWRAAGREKMMGLGRADSDYSSEYPNDYQRRSSSSSNPPAPHAPYGSRRRGLVERRIDSGKARVSASTQGLRPAGRRGERGGLLAQGKKLYQQKVLYLVIVDMPSDEEMAQARADLGLSA